VPVVSTIPLSKLNVESPANVPSAVGVHVSTGLVTITPGPVSFAASTAAVADGVIVICAVAKRGNTTEQMTVKNVAYIFFIMVKW